MMAVLFTAECMNAQTHNGHGYVDLGLPSGTLWATCNVGASKPEDYGDYFAWGETQPKTTYNWENYKWYNGSSSTKYTASDGLITLQPSDDAATANWGGGWQMPSRAQWKELLDNTTKKWTTRNGVSGMLFEAKNGQSLFLPAAGCRDGSSLIGAGSSGGYWSSSHSTDGSDGAWYLLFKSDYCDMINTYRYYGLPVRPVRSARQN